MPRVTLHRHPECERCRRIARVHRTFNWLGRVAFSTEPPPAGALRPGQIALVVGRTGEELRGVQAVRALARQIPAYWPLLPLLHLPPVARSIDRELEGCDGDACAIDPPPAEHPEAAARG
jgi:hypothetical protein